MIGSPHLTTANDTTVAWCELGAGLPLVLLHGLAESHRTWRLVAPRLAGRFRVLMIDLPGHGLSARPEAPYTLPWYADTIAAWMDAIGLERAHICGHSFGGGIAQWMLLEHRSRVDRLALAAAGGLGREVGPALRLAALKAAGPVLDSPLFSSGTRLFMHWASRSFAVREARENERLARLNAAPNSGLAFRRTVSACIGLRGQHMQTWHHIHKIEALPPLALFWGERDGVIPVRHAYEAARRLENTTVTVYPQCGHSLHLEAPSHFSEDLREFLNDEGRSPARLRPASDAPKHFRIRNRRTMDAQSARAA
jgi:pimeloyl-ACP methyl ester carboxylesterase